MKHLLTAAMLLMSITSYAGAPFGLKWGLSKADVFKITPKSAESFFDENSVERCPIKFRSQYADIVISEALFTPGYGLSEIAIIYSPYKKGDPEAGIAKFQKVSELLQDEYGNPFEIADSNLEMGRCLRGERCQGWTTLFFVPPGSVAIANVSFNPDVQGWVVKQNYKSEHMLKAMTKEQEAMKSR